MGPMRTYTLLAWILLFLVVMSSATVPLYTRDKPRSIRGFKNHALSTARGFGKRSDSDLNPSPSTSVDWSQFSERGSFPADWFTDEIQNNVELARLIVQKFIDTNQDGELTADELLRPMMERTTTYK